MNRKSTAHYLQRLREIIAVELADQVDEIFYVEIELDESYFGGKGKGKRRRSGAGGKVPVFDILKCNGKAYTKLIPNDSVRLQCR